MYVYKYEDLVHLVVSVCIIILWLQSFLCKCRVNNDLFPGTESDLLAQWATVSSQPMQCPPRLNPIRSTHTLPLNCLPPILPGHNFPFLPLQMIMQQWGCSLFWSPYQSNLRTKKSFQVKKWSNLSLPSSMSQEIYWSWVLILSSSLIWNKSDKLLTLGFRFSFLIND